MICVYRHCYFSRVYSFTVTCSVFMLSALPYIVACFIVYYYIHYLNHALILTAGLTEVIIYSSPDDKKKNRGFCFLEYESHKAASLAKRRLGTGRIKVWGCDIIVDWADPQEEPDSETMAKVYKNIYLLKVLLS